MIRIQFGEEKAAFTAKLHAMRNDNNSNTHPNDIEAMHSAGIYQQALCQLLDLSVYPTRSQLHERISQLQEEIAALKAAVIVDLVGDE